MVKLGISCGTADIDVELPDSVKSVAGLAVVGDERAMSGFSAVRA